MTRAGIQVALQWPDWGVGIFYTPADGAMFHEPVLVCMIGPLVLECTLPTRNS